MNSNLQNEKNNEVESKEQSSKNKYITWLEGKWPQVLFFFWSIIFIPFVHFETTNKINILENNTAPITESIKKEKPIAIHSEDFYDSKYTESDRNALKQNAIFQSTWSSAALFEVLLIAYSIHIWILVQNFWDTYKLHRKFSGLRLVMSQGWYVLVVAVGFPLGLAVMPEFSTDFNKYIPDLKSHIWLAVLTNLIVILLTAELSTLYYSLDENLPIKTFQDYVKNFIEKIFTDLRLKQLLVSIVLDVITFYFVSRLPSIKDTLNFDESLVNLLIYVSIYASFSSFGAMFTLSTHERVKKAIDLRNEAKLPEEVNDVV